MSETVRLDEIPTVPDMDDDRWAGEPTTNGASARWQRIDLADDTYAIPPEPPALLGLLYRGKRHVISGAPESAKTLTVYAILLHALREGDPVALIDFEMGAVAARRLLDDLGATREELARIYYTEPERPPTDHDIEQLLEHGTRWALIDAAAGAYDATGLDDNLRKDVETFARKWIRPLHAAGVSTIVIDHVTKNAETRGKFAIGSERKGGQADVHLGLEAVKTLTRGGSGLVKVTVHKDRPGYLQRPTAALVELASDPQTHRVSWTLKPYDEGDPETGEFRPTALMESVSKYLERQHEPVSRTNVETTVKGKSAEWIRKALDALIRDDYAAEETGPRNARLVTSTRPYRVATDPKISTPSHPVSPRPDGVTSPRPTPSPPTGDGGRGDELATTSPRPDEIDEQDRALIEHYAEEAEAEAAARAEAEANAEPKAAQDEFRF